MLIASIDGLVGFPEAIETVFPKAQVQLCIVHMVHGSLQYVSWKERRAAAKDLRAIYQAPTEEVAEEALAALEARSDARSPMIGRKWRANWADLNPFFAYPPELRKVMYTTNAIEALNARPRKVTKQRGSFPNPEAVRKDLYLAILKASERWARPVQDWPTALNHLAIVFPGRLPARLTGHLHRKSDRPIETAPLLRLPASNPVAIHDQV